jgi:hypothetical protein
MADEWGPVGPLVGEWDGEGGLDAAYSHAKEQALDTPYLERLDAELHGGHHRQRRRYVVVRRDDHAEDDEPFAHTDHNTLHKVG